VRRIQTDFVPVALKAGLVNNPPVGPEGLLYREIGRSKPAPQGICVANSDGKVLDWALMFDGNRSLVQFLDHCLKRYAAFPDAKKPVPAERYMRFPSRKLPDVKDTRVAIQIPSHHPTGRRCPAQPALKKGTLVGRVVGRALDKSGKPLADTTLQENYLEARFEIPVDVQASFAKALANAGSKRFLVPDEFGEAIVRPAYLGQLDVSPLGGRQVGGRTDRKSWKFWAQRIGNGQPVRVHMTGQSDVSARDAALGRRSDGRRWTHTIRLQWEGYLDVGGNRVTHLVLAAHGHEKLHWGNGLSLLTTRNIIRNLPAGRTLNVDGDVRYGLIAVPCSADEIGEKPARLRANSAQSKRAVTIQRKIKQIHQGVKRRQQQGKNLAPIEKIMQRFGPLIKAGKLDEAEAVLDRALKRLDRD